MNIFRNNEAVVILRSDIDIGLITTAAAGLSECKLLFLNLFPREGIFYWTIKLQQKDAVCHVLMDTVWDLTLSNIQPIVSPYN